ncbi:unnamed protein product, partial [Ectocarpus sp. 8 AP-2014]
MSDEEPWEPLTMADYLMLGIVGTFQAFALGVCIHLFRWRKWPPYVTKNVDIVIVMVECSEVAGFHAGIQRTSIYPHLVLVTFAGFAWTFAGALENGLIRR